MPLHDVRPDLYIEKAMTEHVDTVFGPERPESMRTIVLQGNPAKVLIEASKTAALLVLGSRGHGGWDSNPRRRDYETYRV